MRYRNHVELDGRLLLPLLIGPTDFDKVTDEELELGWRIHRHELMGYGRMVGTRPWGYWAFELGEDKPGAAATSRPSGWPNSGSHRGRS